MPSSSSSSPELEEDTITIGLLESSSTDNDDPKSRSSNSSSLSRRPQARMMILWMNTYLFLDGFVSFLLLQLAVANDGDDGDDDLSNNPSSSMFVGDGNLLVCAIVNMLIGLLSLWGIVCTSERQIFWPIRMATILYILTVPLDRHLAYMFWKSPHLSLLLSIGRDASYVYLQETYYQQQQQQQQQLAGKTAKKTKKTPPTNFFFDGVCV